MKISSVVLVLCLMTFSSKSFAGSVDVAQWIPWSFINSQILQTPLNFSSQNSTFNLKLGEWTPQISGVQYQVQGAVTQSQLDAGGVQTLAQLSGKLSVGELSIDQVIVRNIGGNQFQIRVQAVCQPFEIQISSLSVQATASFVRQNPQANSWGPSLTAVNLQIPPGAWSVSPVTCQGPQGIDSQIVQQIQQALSAPENFQEILRSYLAPKLGEVWNRAWSSLSQSSWQNLKIDSMSDPAEKGFYLLAHLDLTSASHMGLPSKLEVSSEDQPLLLMSTDGFAALAQDRALDFNIENYNLQGISSFASFMHNRFFQFFLWPDLLNISKNAPVTLSTLPDQNQVQLKSNGVGTWALTLQTKGVIQVPRDGQIRNYIRWGLGLGANLKTDVQDSRLLLTTSQTSTNMNWAFDDDYVQTFHPSTWISSSILKKATQSLFENRSLEIALPVLHWQDKDMKLNGWTQQGGLIELGWK